MKKTHVVALTMMIAAIGMLIYSSKDLSSFSTFEQAEKTGQRVKVSGQLVKTKSIVYNPEVDANFFSFHMLDDNNEERQVIINQSKPRDFERSESIVLTGKMSPEGHFQASEMLLKCPSKYKNEELSLRNKIKVVAAS